MTSFVVPAEPVPRDRFGRPLVKPPGGGKPVPYTRCTTYVDALEDKFGLQKWMMRMTAIGLSMREDLLLAVAAHRDDKDELDRIVEDAKEAAAARSAANTGQALHKLCEKADRGEDLGVVPTAYAPDIAAYTAATEALTPVLIEEFCVLDDLRIGGTPDRVVEYRGGRFIVDIKTGQVEYGAVKIAMQLSVYARSEVYDVATGDRAPHGANLERGIVVHLPAGAGACTLHWVDLQAGWAAVQVARQVRDKRSLRFKDLFAPFDAGPSLLERIRLCGTAEEVRALWAANTSAWSDELTAVAREHIASLSEGASA